MCVCDCFVASVRCCFRPYYCFCAVSMLYSKDDIVYNIFWLLSLFALLITTIHALCCLFFKPT
jgi:hypothetical protein